MPPAVSNGVVEGIIPASVSSRKVHPLGMQVPARWHGVARWAAVARIGTFCPANCSCLSLAGQPKCTIVGVCSAIPVRRGPRMILQREMVACCKAQNKGATVAFAYVVVAAQRRHVMCRQRLPAHSLVAARCRPVSHGTTVYVDHIQICIGLFHRPPAIHALPT